MTQDRVMDARQDAWDASGFGRLHKGMVWQECGDQWFETHQLVYRQVKENQIAVLLGPRGVGKTQMACSIAHELNFVLGRSCRYLRMSDFAAEMRDACYNGGSAKEAAWLNSHAVKPLLVLDELHEGLKTEFDATLLRGTIDRRYMKKRPTILISNHTPAEFEKAVGESVMSRIAECGRVFVCKWPSYRVRGHTAVE